MEEKKKIFSASDYKKMKDNPLISKEMLNFVKKKISYNKYAFSKENSESALKKLDPELIVRVIKKMLQE